VTYQSELSTSASIVTPTVGRVIRRSLFWVGAFTVLVVVVVLVMLGSSGVKDANALSATNAAPSGAKALVEVLRQQGVTVTIADSFDDAAAAIDDPTNTTLFVYDRDFYLSDPLRERLPGITSRIVFLDPAYDDLSVIAPSVAQAGEVEGELDADCELPSAATAESITGDGTGFRVVENSEEDAATDTATCFGSGDEVYSLIRVTSGDDVVTVIGTMTALSNDAIANQGNAALALHLLGEKPNLVWYIPTPADIAGGEPPTLAELTPSWVSPAIALTVIAVVLAALWRGRRLGPLVVENLPVTVRASETMRGRARLYERSSARLHALDSLRLGTIARVAVLCGLGQSASVEGIIAASAALTGRDPATVRSILVDAVPLNDRELVALSDELLTLERDVTTAVRPA
jgi:hypothetical protein